MSRTGPKSLGVRTLGPARPRKRSETMDLMSTTIQEPAPGDGDEGGGSGVATTLEERLTQVADLEARLEQREARRDGWMLFVLVLAGGAIVLTILGIGLGIRAMNESRRNADRAGTGAVSANAKPTVVRLGDLTIAPKIITATTTGGLNVQNGGKLEHNLMIEGQGHLMTPMIGPGGSARLRLSSLGPRLL